MTTYRQCKLQKGNVVQTSWVPKEFAVEGRELKLRKEIGGGCVKEYTGWDNRWKVVSVSFESEVFGYDIEWLRSLFDWSYLP